MTWQYYAWYLDTSTGPQSIVDDLDRLGEDEWELVTVVPHTSEVSGAVLVAIFKRPAE